MNYLIEKPRAPKRYSKILACAKLWLNKILCWVIGHKWTCNAEQGILPTPEQVQRGTEGFEEYAEMYCTRCERTCRPLKFDL